MRLRPTSLSQNAWRLCLVAMSFLTCLPVSRYRYYQGDLSRAAVFFPVVGGLIGALNYGIFFFLRILKVDQWIIALVIVSSSLIFTRGLHLDGWADVCDALFAPRKPEERREILKDSHVGTYGVAGVFLLMGFKVVALGGDFAPLYLIIAPIAGRTASLILGGFLKPLRREKRGLGEEFIGKVPYWVIWFWVMVTIGFPFFWEGTNYIFGAVTIFIIVLIFDKMMERSFGGLSGDAVGATIELAETLFLYLGRI